MHRKLALLTAASAAIALTAGSASAETIYQDDFIGHPDDAADGLNGETPDIGANNWVAGAAFSANGSVGDTVGTSATLAFTPVDGLVYTLDASFRNYANTGSTSPDEDWLGLGFADGQSTATGNSHRFVGSSNPRGIAWMLARGNTTASVYNVAWLGSATNGNPVGESALWTSSLADDYGADLDLRIVLDTTGGAGNWTATWFAKLPTDAGYTEVRPTTALINETINSVGIARSAQGFTADVTAFSLTSVPEPGSLALLGLGGLLIARRRRN